MDISVLFMLNFSSPVMLVASVLHANLYVTKMLQTRLANSVYESINATPFFSSQAIVLFSSPFKREQALTEENVMVKEIDRIRLRRWRKRGFYSENALVKLLQKNGYNAVRVPVSNPSLNPLPDIMARKGAHVFAFEVKNASYYAYFPKQQIDKLFRFLNELIPADKEHKHAVIAAHLGKKWLFKEISWVDWEKDKLPEKVRILKRDRGNLNIEKSY
jgi:Holliday junction resolvase